MLKCIMDNKKANRLAKEQIKTKLLDWTTINEVLASKDSNKEADEVQDLDQDLEFTKILLFVELIF